MGLLDWLGMNGGGAPGLAPNELEYVQSQGYSPTPNPLTGNRQAALQGLWSGLSQLGAGLAAAGARRPVGAPGVTVGQAFGSVPQAVGQGQMRGWQQQQLQRQEGQQGAWDRLLAGIPEAQRPLYEALGAERGPAALAQAGLRQGRMGTPEEHAAAGLPMGTLYFDQTNRPHVLPTPGVAGLTAGAQERARAPFHPTQLAPGATLIENPGLATGQPSVPGTSGALPQLASAESGNNPRAVNRDTGAAGIYQFTPQTWAWLRQSNPDFGRRYSDADIMNERAQAEAAPLFERAILQRNQDLIGRTVNGVQVTPDALVRGGWLGGPDGVRAYVLSNGQDDRRDANQTRVSEYFNGTARNMRGGRSIAPPPQMPEPFVSAPALPPGIPPEMMRGAQPAPQAPAASTVAGQPGGPRVIAQSPVSAPGTPERAFDQRYGTGLGEQAMTIHVAANSAQERLDQVAQLRTALQALRAAGTNTGAGTPAALAITRVMQAAGLNPEALGLASSAAPGEAVTAIVNRLATAMIGPGGLPANNFSEADRNFLVQTMPSLANRPEANEFLVNVMERTARRSLEMENQWLEARGQGKDYPTFLREWRQYTSQNPIITPQDRAAASQMLAGRPAPEIVPARQPEELPALPRQGATTPATPAASATIPTQTTPPRTGTPAGPPVVPPVGATATNPRTGERARFDGMRWVPIPPGQ